MSSNEDVFIKRSIKKLTRRKRKSFIVHSISSLRRALTFFYVSVSFLCLLVHPVGEPHDEAKHQDETNHRYNSSDYDIGHFLEGGGHFECRGRLEIFCLRH